MTVPNVWSSQTPQDMKASSPAVFYDSTSSTNDAQKSSNLFQSVSRNANLFKSPVVGDRFSASHRYIPNEHHRVVANVSLDSAANLIPCSERKLEPKLGSSLSQPAAVSQHFGYSMSSEQYTECPNSKFMYPSSSKGMSCMSQMPIHSNGNKLDNEKVPQVKEIPASECIVQSSNLNKKVHELEEEHLCQKRQKYEGSQPSFLRPHQVCEQYQKKQHILVGNRDFEQLHSESTPSCNLLEQMPIDPTVAHEMIKQEQPPTVDENAWLQSTASRDVSCGDYAMTPKKPEPFEAIHNVLFLYEHARNCQDEGKDCSFLQCMNFKRTLSHVLHCKDANCTKRCFKFKRLFDHYRECSKCFCSICGPVRRRMKEISQRNYCNAFTELKVSYPTVSSLDHKESATKRAKTTHQFGENEIYEVSPQIMNCTYPTGGEVQAGQEVSMPVDTNTRNGEIMKCVPIDSNTTSAKPVERQDMDCTFRSSEEFCGTITDYPQVGIKEEICVEATCFSHVATYSEENVVQLNSSKVDKSGKCNTNLPAAANMSETKIKTPKRVISLLDTFTPEKLREHIRSLEQHIGEGKSNTHKSENVEHLIDQNSCSLCGMEKLTFEVPSRYCASCYKQINPKGVYYTMTSAKYDYGAKVSFCGKCYGASGESIKVGQQEIQKSNLERRLNYAETDAETEWWVQCDKCKAWQHQICALFNGKRMESLQAEYICPNCFLNELENGKNSPMPQNADLRANDLPRTILSDHIEQRVFERLKQEREERARILEKTVDEVPGAEDLIIRVVSSIDKKLEVCPAFHEVFKEKMYPTHFPYKSKVILLFQNIEGADVFLFGMYVQEYGSECPLPNQRRVCISYIDSVKYFRPDIKAATGEALRTFVYHEILIGYLDYCKRRGFTSCYIWACPSLRQDYYILYCHPKMQKTPKSDKLREWYQIMIRKAMKEKIILERTNLYDYFFMLTSECKAKVTAARLPYFDSDFWPGKAEILLLEDKNESHAKGTKTAVQRALRAAKRDAMTGNPKDILLVHQLGEIIRPIKEDFIMVHLQHTCKYCYQPIVYGKQWVCNSCKNFQLCEQCYDKMLNLDSKDRHPVAAKEKHSFLLVESDILGDIDDKDGTIQSKLFDLRTGFLSFCQNEQYQFDTLRRAKHSTMMILFHLHNPTAPVFTFSCALCHKNIDSGQNWHCMICQGYHLCDSCYHRKGASHHMHQLVRDATTADRTLKPKQQSYEKIQIVLDVLLHASKCEAPGCTFVYCLKVKKLFFHSRNCKVRSHGGCPSCKKIWLLLQRHACACQELDCPVPRCKDLKDYMRKVRQ
ncbi:histone acetyltransferase HAC1-like isoform X2 [Canna indica]|uniref:histone acetyltransferase n=1 Tax=Canna indica TaxID=4628 RepID=A0AAQ3Q8C0_9LILI|nr:histone acetyltransferase HAC1-like isoform X2 [Canna indica]